MAAVTALALAACGGGGGAGGSAAAPAGTDETINSAEGQRFRQLMGFTDQDLKNLRGKEFKLGAILALSGSGANFAVDQGNGFKLAIDNAQRYLGVKVTSSIKDHKSGDPQAGAAAARELGIDGYGAVMNSYYGVFGSTLQSLQQYRMLSFDPGGGTGNSLKGKDYFYGFRANVPDDGFFALKYFAQEKPEAKRVALVIWDAGAAYVGPIEANLQKSISENGMTYTGKIQTKIGATDYSSALSQLKEMKPDIVAVSVLGGADPGYFMKQYVNSGIPAQALGFEYVPAAKEVSAGGYDKFWFASDFFPVQNPPNPLSKFFLSEHQRLYGQAPGSFYQGNYYEATLAYLQLAARVAARGGDMNKGDELNKEMTANPTFKSIYGGDVNTVGTITFDPSTHDPAIRPVGLFQASDFKQMAQWNIGGGDFKASGSGS